MIALRTFAIAVLSGLLVALTLFAFSTLLSGCGPVNEPATFKLQTGEIVSCRYSESRACGISLWGCSDERYFNCLQNVEVIR